MAIALTVASAGCAGRGSRQAHARRTAADLEPVALMPTPLDGGGAAIVTARVRFYVDAAYRAQNPGHESSLRLLVARTSRLFEPTIGVRLEVADIRAWERGAGSDLEAALAALEDLDQAEDVAWIVGMVDALGQVSTELHQLGIARPLGRHIILRGTNDAAEVALLEDVLDAIGSRERAALYGRRKQHKERVLFLHELGHSLGAMHVTSEASLLFPQYDRAQSSFGAENARLMRVTAAARLGDAKRDPQREWRAVLAHLRAHPWEGWNADESAALVADLESRVVQAAESATEDLGVKVRPADRETFRAAARLLADGRALDAWAELEPLIDFYPDEAGVQLFACRLAVAAGRDKAAVRARCERATSLAPSAPEPHLRLAQALLKAGDKPASLASTRRAHAILEKLGSASEKMWLELATHYQALGAATWAEAAGSRGKGSEAVVAWARATRARYGISPGGAVKPEDEAEYVERLRELLKAIYAHDHGGAEKQAAAMTRRFGPTAGVLGARCDLEIRRRQYAAARARCTEALRRDGGAAWAHYLTGLLDKRDKRPADAIGHLERAIALDPDLEHAYQVAAELHAEAGRTAERKKLAERYKAKFGRDMP